MLLWFPLLLCVHACMQSTQGRVNVCDVLYCSLSCVWESDVSRHPYPMDTHSLSLSNTHTDTHTTRASQLESVRRLNISQWVETWQRHWVHLNVSLCETRGLWKKYTPQNITHTRTHTHSASEKWRSVRQGCREVGGLCGLDVCLCQMSDVIFPPTLWKTRGEGEWLVKEHARWKDARQMSSHTFPPFFFILCAFFILRLCLSSSFLLTFSLSHLFSFTLGSGGITDRSQLEPGLKASRDISVIIKPALRLPNTSSLMCSHSHTHTHTHTRRHMHTYTHHLAEWSNHFSHRR